MKKRGGEAGETPRFIPLAHAPLETLAQVSLLLTDIDDTLTTEGRLPAAAYGALERLAAAGIAVVPLTGRPAGWCDMIARFWPVAGVVGENGAFAFRYDHAARRMDRTYARSKAERTDDRARLDALGQQILKEVPGSALAADQAFRVADLAIDYCEDVAPLDAVSVGRIVALFEAAGATAKVSSIHVNGWFGATDKLAMARRFLAQDLRLDLDGLGLRALFVGDSPNDEPLFAALPLTVGVANTWDFAARLAHPPRYVTQARGGEGFAELADALLIARQPRPGPRAAEAAHRGARAPRRGALPRRG